MAEKLTAKHNFLLFRADNRMIFVHCLRMYVCYTQFQGTLPSYNGSLSQILSKISDHGSEEYWLQQPSSRMRDETSVADLVYFAPV